MVCPHGGLKNRCKGTHSSPHNQTPDSISYLISRNKKRHPKRMPFLLKKPMLLSSSHDVITAF